MVENLIGLEALLDDVQVAAILKVKSTTLQQWRSRGEGPRWVPCGDLPRYRLEDVQSYINSRVVTPTPKPKPEKTETTPKRKRGRPRGQKGKAKK
jgi:hypothetical protein